jgi:L-seryl-tRNA(Ser) seleniumtransferase
LIRDGSLDHVPPVPPLVLAQARVLVDGKLQPVINATGVVVHTNLGRAPWAPQALDAVARVAGGYCDLELDLASGTRGGRLRGPNELLAFLTGCEAALVVNNNAAAVLLALTALARGKEVICSRGELVEIGGSFRVPDVIASGGARLVEVGTTNRTRASDYAAAIGPDTALLLKVHPSNFRIVGFTEEPDRADLVDWMAAQVRAHPAFDGPEGDEGSWAVPPPDWVETRYERKALAAGRRPAYLTATRRPRAG